MALSKTQLMVLEALRDSALVDRFYWSGGTALAEQYLHHRASLDIDLFADQPFRYEEILPVAQAVKVKTGMTKLAEHHIFDRWEFFLTNHHEVKFEFVHYPFPALGRRTRWHGVLVDSLDDIAANKVMALLDRHEPKDAVDLYYLMTKKGFTSARLFALAQKKFGVRIDASDFWGRLLWGGERVGEIRVLLHGTRTAQDRTIRTIQKFVATESARATRRLISRG